MLAAIDSWLFLLLVGVAAMLRWLASKGTTSSKTIDTEESPAPSREPPTRQQPGSDEEQIRKFLEALGQPRTAKPPPPIQPRTDIAPRPVAPVQPPASMVPFPKIRTAKSRSERSPEPERERRIESIPPPLPKRAYEPQPAARPAETTVFEVREAVSEVERSAPAWSEPAAKTISAQQTTNFARLLGTPDGLRQAIILREIFGPPRSIRPLEDLPGTA